MIESRLAVTKQTPLARRGLVVAEHPLGARVGGGILEAGGNAVDAAVATAFAMTVVEPFMSTIGGSGTMLVHRAKRGDYVQLFVNGLGPVTDPPASGEPSSGERLSFTIVPPSVTVGGKAAKVDFSGLKPGTTATLALPLASA